MADPNKKYPETTIERISVPMSNKVGGYEGSEHNRNNVHDSSPADSTEDERVVDWTGPNDPDMPLNWPKYRKVATVAVVTACRFMVMLASSMMSPALVQIKADFEDSSQTLITFTVSIYVIGIAVGPLVLAPLSETYGRSWIYHSGNILYTLFSVGCALSPNPSTLLVFRLLAGLAGSAPVTNAGGTIADIIPRERRGLINSIFGSALVFAPALAPIAGGYLAEDMGWRWIFWIMTIVSGLITIVSFAFLQETYSPVLLQRKAARLRRETGNTQLQARGRTHQLPFLQKLGRALRRPIVLLVASPVLIIASLYLAFVYGITYLLLTSMPLVFREVYGWGEGALGLSSLSLGIGCFLGVFITGRYSDRIYQRQKDRSGYADQAESRLFFVLPAAVILPAGLLIYGWTVHFKSHWIAPLIGTGAFGTGLVFAFNAINSYLIDAFSIYAASALAANGLIRGIAGGLLPLSGPEMYERLGYGSGNTLLAFLAVGFGSVSVFLWAFGRALRMKYPVDLE